MSIRKEKPKLEEFKTLKDALKGDKPSRHVGEIKMDAAHAKRVNEMQKFFKMGGQLPVSAMREAIGTGAWDSIMLDAMHKRMMKGWGGALQRLHWDKLVSQQASLSDFRTRNVIQRGTFTTLSVVPEGGDYHEVEFSDDRATYTPKKYGAIFGLSYEALSNDDLSALSTIPNDFGGAAARTIEKYMIYTLLDQNADTYDGNSLFDNSNHANDLGTGKPLNHDNLEAAIEKMLVQTDIDGNYLSIPPRYLLVNPAQYYDALRLIKSEARPGTANNDINVHKGELEVIASSWVTATYWYLIADPSMCETFEVGFLGGRREPEIFEESPQAGHAFSNDERRWKCRLVFGAASVDWRGFCRGYA